MVLSREILPVFLTKCGLIPIYFQFIIDHIFKQMERHMVFQSTINGEKIFNTMLSTITKM